MPDLRALPWQRHGRPDAADLAALRAALGRVPLPWRRRVAVLVGGMLGTALRMGITGVVPVGVTTFPWPTLWVNTSGALALGLLVGRLQERRRHARVLLPLVGIGLLGSYTTFSTLAVEAVQLGEAGRIDLAGGYALGSVLVGLPAAAIGLRLGRWRPRLRVRWLRLRRRAVRAQRRARRARAALAIHQRLLPGGPR